MAAGKRSGTERRLPAAINRNLITYWPEMTCEKHVDFKSENTVVTLCHATNRQIDDHARAMEMVITGLDKKLATNLMYGVAVCRLCYYCKPDVLPEAADIEG